MDQEQFRALIEPVVTSFKNLELWGTQHLIRSKNNLLRIYIESAEGVSVEDCEKVSRQISALLDVEDLIQGEYTLEVSSPGLDRPLFKLSHYESFVGTTVNMKLNAPFEGRRKFKGQLVAVKGDEIVIIADDDEYNFPFECIEHARVVPLFD